MNRREFIRHSILASTATILSSNEAQSKGVKWQIGCLNRPWTKWSFDQTLQAISASGFKTTGLLTRTREEPFIGADATPEYLESLKKRIAANGLRGKTGGLTSAR